MENMVIDPLFWRGKRVFLTGHTGFKGSWLSRIFVRLGACLTGYALAPSTNPNLYSVSELDSMMDSVLGDIRDKETLSTAFLQAQPEIVIHMAAQPLVRESYANPADTYAVNVMGTVNLLECVLRSSCVESVVVVTTDKVYENSEWEWGYRENDPLGGHDPYSNSKACAELVAQCYRRSFFSSGRPALSTMRAGNVIGGGDFSPDRIIPDCIRAAIDGREVSIRSPKSVRPYQHVLEPLHAYLLVAEKQFHDFSLSGSYNIGPDERDTVTTGELAEMFCRLWGHGQRWVTCGDSGPHEAKLLRLDCSRIKGAFGWRPRLDVESALTMTIDWAKAFIAGENVAAVMDTQIARFEGNDVAAWRKTEEVVIA